MLVHGASQVPVQRSTREASPRSEVVYPMPRAEHLQKRRRLAGKRSLEICLEDCQEVLNRVKQVLPRVGKMEIQQSDILNALKAMFPDKELVSVIAFRGMDRPMAPPSHILPAEAPYR